MYVPPAFAATDPAVLQDLMTANPFALLVTGDDDGVPFASHLPMLWQPDGGDAGHIAGHMARANPQWRHFADGRPVLAVFAGPHHYISPSWYDNAPAVPTWNYAAVHAYGVPRLIDDAAHARAHLAKMVARFEADLPAPWTMDLPDDYVDGMVRGIVGFEIPVDRLEGKLKMSQNRPPADRDGAIAGLEGLGDDSAAAAAALMRSLRASS